MHRHRRRTRWAPASSWSRGGEAPAVNNVRPWRCHGVTSAPEACRVDSSHLAAANFASLPYLRRVEPIKWAKPSHVPQRRAQGLRPRSRTSNTSERTTVHGARVEGTMAALQAGTKAPDFSLHATPDQTVSLHEC